MSSFRPLNANDDVRDATRSAVTFERALRISSAIPSAKNSVSASALMLTKGRTAMDRPGGADELRAPVPVSSTVANSARLA